jgi:hypothetical protein
MGRLPHRLGPIGGWRHEILPKSPADADPHWIEGALRQLRVDKYLVVKPEIVGPNFKEFTAL